MTYKLIIFDFDGTLADTFSWFKSITNHMADRYKFRRIDISEEDELRGYDAAQMIKHLRIPLWKIPFMARYMHSLMNEQIHTIRLFEGVDRMLKHFSEIGILLAVVTSNSCKNVHHILGPQNSQLIQFYECGASIFHKTGKLKKILKKSGIPPQEAFCIGDEIRDIQAANQAKIPCGAVSWGYNKVESLIDLKPKEVFHSVDDIIKKLA